LLPSASPCDADGMSCVCEHSRVVPDDGKILRAAGAPCIADATSVTSAVICVRCAAAPQRKLPQSCNPATIAPHPVRRLA